MGSSEMSIGLRLARSAFFGAPFVLAALAGGCNGPTPRDASSPALHLTSSRVAVNLNAIEEVTPTPAVLGILAAPDRLAADKEEDGPRQAANFLTFLDVRPGMRVAEIESGTGYTTELLARSVGPTGEVIAENEPAFETNGRMERRWEERLARPVNASTRRVDRALASPLPADARGLDLVLLGAPYGRLEARRVDVDAMNHAVHLALRPGGRYVVLVRTPLEGNRTVNLHALHAAESRHVRDQVESAGFAFVSEGRFFRDSPDWRDWDASPADPPPSGEKIDRFVLTFVRE